jgi:N-acetylmuramoyl-L-alanine amidase
MAMAAMVTLALTASSAGSQPSDPIGELLLRQGLETAPPAAAPSALPVVIGVSLVESANRARFLIELSDPVDVKVFTLTNPNRIVIDMPEVLWRVSGESHPSGKGAVRSYRYGLFRKGNSRFVIDLAAPAKVDMPQLFPPDGAYSFRLAIDLTPTTPEAFVSNSGWPDGNQVASVEPPRPLPPAPRTNGKRMIVIDAGHGGIDPGTHGATGLQEKDIVLAVAKDLRKALEATGRYATTLTRDSDVFIPLRERVNISRAARGDLFVSLHIDSEERHEVRGASVYTLSESASDKEAAKLADKENMSDVIAGVDLTGENNPVASILIDLAQRDTMNRSARFAETVVSSLPVATMVRPTTPHRSAGFAVLKAPDVPAVLIELGYLSNTRDEALMATSAWRAKVAQAIAKAIDSHFSVETATPGRQAAIP